MIKILAIGAVWILLIISFNCEVREIFITSDRIEQYDIESLDNLMDVLFWDTNALDNDRHYFECNFKQSELSLLLVERDGVILSNNGRLMKIKENGEIVLDREYFDLEGEKRLDVVFLSTVSDGGYMAIFSYNYNNDEIDYWNEDYRNYYISKLNNNFEIEWINQLGRDILDHSTVVFTVSGVHSIVNLGDDRYGVVLVGHTKVFVGKPGKVDIYRKLYIIIDKNGKIELGRFFGSDADAMKHYIFNLVPAGSPKNGYLMISEEYDGYDYNDGYQPSCSGDIYITKLDKNGNIIWKKAYDYWFAGRYVFDYKMLRRPEGGYIIGGGMGYIGEDNKSGYFILEIDEDGDVIKSIGYDLYNKEGRELQNKLEFGINFERNNRGEYVLSGLYSGGIDKKEYFVIMKINGYGEVKWVYNKDESGINEGINCVKCNCIFDTPYLLSLFSNDYLYMRGYRIYCGDMKVGEIYLVKNMSDEGNICGDEVRKEIQIKEGLLKFKVNECEKRQKGMEQISIDLENRLNKVFFIDYKENKCSICKNR